MTASQIIRSPSTGLTRRTTAGKEWCVIVQQDPASPCEMLIFKTEAKAQEICDYIGRDAKPEVHYVECCEKVCN